MQQAIDYYEVVVTDDIFSIHSTSLRHDEFKARQVMRSYARNVSIAATSLGVSPEGLFKDMRTFGLLFESLAVRDLRVYADVLGAKVYKFRDSKKREADIVMQFKDDSYTLIEVKLGGQQEIEEAAKKLTIIRDDIDQDKTGKPAFLMIITKGNVALKRKDGVYVVPLACLKP